MHVFGRRVVFDYGIFIIFWQYSFVGKLYLRHKSETSFKFESIYFSERPNTTEYTEWRRDFDDLIFTGEL